MNGGGASLLAVCFRDGPSKKMMEVVECWARDMKVGKTHKRMGL